MFGSGVLDVAIGLVFVFLLVSLLVTTLNEFVAALLSSRANWLQKGMVRLLGTELAAELYRHPLIQGSFLDGPGPSYIASRAFATALVDIVGRSDKPLNDAATTFRAVLDKASDADSVQQLVLDLAAATQSASTLGPTAKKLASDVDALSKRFLAESYTVGDAKRDIQRLLDGAAVRYGGEIIANMKNDQLRGALLPLFHDAQRDIAGLKENIEIWFNQSMDRVGGWYKRKSQWVIAGIALGVTVVLNVDALLVVAHLNTQPGLRDAVVAQAKAFSDQPRGAPAGDNAKEGDKVASGVSPEEALARAHAVEQELGKLSLPIGWFMPAAPDKVDEIGKFRSDNFLVLPVPLGKDGKRALDLDRFGSTVWFHLVGWLLTAVAASLGAPFWFDTLNKFMSIRAAGKAPEEKPKSPKEVPIPLEPGQSPVEADRASGIAHR